ncbi:MAG: hypothetical protein GF350_04995 [Chitinivibrionales bacterium]|nr:hypothetical protein [Chitinivibrionales bacterium]
MKVLSYFITIVLTAIILAAIVCLKFPSVNNRVARRRIAILRTSVQRKLEQQKESLIKKLDAFANVTAQDRDFAMRLLVETDRSASDVVERAQQFIHPMNLDILEITDSAFVLLSSGHFPASAGNSIEEKCSMLDESPAFLMDNIMGDSVATLQAKVSFAIAELPFYVSGGVIIDNEFLSRLMPLDDVYVLLKTGDEIIGGKAIGNIGSISDIEDQRIIINSKEFLADTIAVSFQGEERDATFYVLSKVPGPLSVLSIFNLK